MCDKEEKGDSPHVRKTHAIVPKWNSFGNIFKFKFLIFKLIVF